MWKLYAKNFQAGTYLRDRGTRINVEHVTRCRSEIFYKILFMIHTWRGDGAAAVTFKSVMGLQGGCEQKWPGS